MNNCIAILIIALFLVSITTMYSLIDSLTGIETYMQMPTELITYADMSDLNINMSELNSMPQAQKKLKQKKAKGKKQSNHLFNGFMNFYENTLNSPFKQNCNEEKKQDDQEQSDMGNGSQDKNLQEANIQKYIDSQNKIRQMLRNSVSNITKTYFLDEHIFGSEKNAFGIVSIRNDFMINPQQPQKHSSLDLFMIKDDILDSKVIKSFQNPIEYIQHSFNLQFPTKIITSFQSGENYIGISLKGINYGQVKDRQIGLIDLKKVEQNNSNFYEEFNVEPQSDISTLSLKRNILVYANKEDYVLFRSRVKIGNEWKNITSMHMIKNTQRLFSQTLSLNFINISYDQDCLNTLLVSYTIGQDDSMLYKGDIFCLKKSKQPYQIDQKNEVCDSWQQYEPFIRHKFKSLREDLLYNWEQMFSAITKQMEFEVRKVDIFSLNLYKYFSFFYDRTRNKIVSSFLNKYIFITNLIPNQRSGDNHYFKIESFERDNTRVQKIMYSHYTDYVFILAQNYMQHSKVFMINIKDLDVKNSANVYRADFFYYDDELMVKDLKLVENKSEEQDIICLNQRQIYKKFFNQNEQISSYHQSFFCGFIFLRKLTTLEIKPIYYLDNQYSTVKLVLENGDLAIYNVRSDEPIQSDQDDSSDYPIYISIFLFGFIFFQQIFQRIFSRLNQANNARIQQQRQQQQQQQQNNQQQQQNQQQNNQQNNQNPNIPNINNSSGLQQHQQQQQQSQQQQQQQQQQNQQQQQQQPQPRQTHQIILPPQVQQLINQNLQSIFMNNQLWQQQQQQQNPQGQGVNQQGFPQFFVSNSNNFQPLNGNVIINRQNQQQNEQNQQPPQQ